MFCGISKTNFSTRKAVSFLLMFAVLLIVHPYTESLYPKRLSKRGHEKHVYTVYENREEMYKMCLLFENFHHMTL